MTLTPSQSSEDCGSSRSSHWSGRSSVSAEVQACQAPAMGHLTVSAGLDLFLGEGAIK